MAQSKSFFGLRKGSTKSLTFQVLNGKQITKDRVYNVKNPQTLAQMQQRALMATAVSAYSNLKAICDHSFEGIEVGSKTMSEFIKLNLAKLSSEMPNVTSFITWGISDKHSWVPSTFPGTGNALLYDADFKPKPVYNEILKELKK